MNAWAPYAQSDASPWNLRRVVHLHRRGGFAASWDVIERDLAEGPDVSLQRLLSGRSGGGGARDEFERMSSIMRDAAVGSNHPNRLKAWWLYRMIFSPDPLGERLVLMWHNHFATSNHKVQDVRLMAEQNEILRTYAQSRFGDLLPAVVRHPAMLVWLDADSNRREHPNENLARELMELFSMGVGNYTEDDVKEAARALTGWTAANGRFRFFDAYHDAGEKTILGRRGPFNGDDLVKLVLDHPATARRLAERICGLFFGDGVLERTAVDELAAGLQERDLDVGWAVKTVLRSAAFFSEANMGSRILGPVEFVVGAVRACEFVDPPPSTLLLAEWTARLGQDLFYPPSVFGWEEGRAWMTTRSAILRNQFAFALTAGRLQASDGQPNVLAVTARHGRDGSVADALRFFTQLMLGHLGDDPTIDNIAADVTDAASKTGAVIVAGDELRLNEAGVRRIAARILSSPCAQLG